MVIWYSHADRVKSAALHNPCDPLRLLYMLVQVLMDLNVDCNTRSDHILGLEDNIIS